MPPPVKAPKTAANADEIAGSMSNTPRFMQAKIALAAGGRQGRRAGFTIHPAGKLQNCAFCKKNVQFATTRVIMLLTGCELFTVSGSACDTPANKEVRLWSSRKYLS